MARYETISKNMAHQHTGLVRTLQVLCNSDARTKDIFPSSALKVREAEGPNPLVVCHPMLHGVLFDAAAPLQTKYIKNPVYSNLG